jgi:hypothetical protein
LHFDPQYKQGSDPTLRCTNGTGMNRNFLHNKIQGNSGQFGDYECDTPKSMLEAGLNFMAQTKTPDFIIWTGYSIPFLSYLFM